MGDKININKLYFGVVLYDGIGGRKKLKQGNLFGYASIKWAIATYVVMNEKRKAEINDPLFFCFSDVWSRSEYEFIVCPWLGCKDDDTVGDVGEKVDLFTMYVEPNRELLMEMVNRVSLNSAKNYLKEHRAKYLRPLKKNKTES